MRKFLCIAILALAGCTGHDGSSTAPITVQPAISGEKNTIVVHDESLKSPTITVLMKMADMGMPPVSLTLQRTSDGNYIDRDVDFTMSGTWKISTKTTPEHDLDLTVR